MARKSGSYGFTSLVPALLLACAVFASPATAEDAGAEPQQGVPLRSETALCKDSAVSEDEVKVLVETYYGFGRNDWERFQKEALAVIKQLSFLPPEKSNGRDAWYFLLFPEPSRAAQGTKPEVVYRRALVHAGTPPAFQSTRIVFDKNIALFDIHIIRYSDDGQPIAPVKTDYTATRVSNPVVGGIKKALALVVGNWQTKTLLLFQKEETESVAYRASVTRVSLPFGLDRATITLTDSAGDGTTGTGGAGSSSYYLAPLTYVEIGLGAAYIERTALNQAAKVDSSTNLVDATPTTLLTYVAANWRPWGYDESVRKQDFRQDFRIVIGPALTPNPGLVVGFGYAPVASLRPISVQVGFGVLLADVLRTGDSLGKPPHDPGHPTKRGALGVWFIGLGYGLQ